MADNTPKATRMPYADEPEDTGPKSAPTPTDYLSDIFTVLEEIRDAIKEVASAIESLPH